MPTKRTAEDHELVEVREVDPDGRIVVHHRTVDTLGKMLRAGTISPEMHDAARAFQADFTIANLDPIRAAPMLRVPGAGREPDLSERQLDARRRVHAAMQALGGIGSPGGSCLWHVLGCGCSIREWAIRRGWNGRPVDQKEAKGILVAALGMLARQYSYSEARPLRRAHADRDGPASATTRPQGCGWWTTAIGSKNRSRMW